VGTLDTFKAFLSRLYKTGLYLDQKYRKRIRLENFVFSVGNIAMGGRAKTPMVVNLCLELQKRGYSPVVLTRGYGRKIKKPFWILPNDPSFSFILANTQESVTQNFEDYAGDEALEIAIKARNPVLVGSDRVQNAQSFIQQKKINNVVFVLDDAFQHWSLERNYDIVLITSEDLKDKVFPSGFLREDPGALSRAQLVLCLGEDLIKRSILPHEFLENRNKVFKHTLVTGRAPDLEISNQIKKLIGCEVLNEVTLNDHASKSSLLHAMESLPKDHCIFVTYKEAVKLFSIADLINGKCEFVLDSGHKVYCLDLKLEFKNPLIWDEICFSLESFK
jgi:tetraacyldisaccharide 4'-kinase